MPSHVRVVGKEQADQQAAKGARTSLQQVTVHKTITDIWANLGSEEMPDEYSDSDVFWGSRISEDQVLDDESDFDTSVKRPSGCRLLLTGARGVELTKQPMKHCITAEAVNSRQRSVLL